MPVTCPVATSSAANNPAFVVVDRTHF